VIELVEIISGLDKLDHPRLDHPRLDHPRLDHPRLDHPLPGQRSL
jgi:hypothetical protein